MASYTEKATLIVVDQATGPVNKINAALKNLMRTSAAFARATEAFSRGDKFAPLTRQVRNLREEFNGLNRAARAAGRGTSLAGGIGGVAPAARRATRDVAALRDTLTAAGRENRRFGLTTARPGLVPAAQIRANQRQFDNQTGLRGYDTATIGQNLTSAHVRAARAGVEAYERGLQQVEQRRAAATAKAIRDKAAADAKESDTSAARTRLSQAQRDRIMQSVALQRPSRRVQFGDVASSSAQLPLQRLTAEQIANALAVTNRLHGATAPPISGGGGVASALMGGAVVAAASRKPENGVGALTRADSRLLAAREKLTVAEERLAAARLAENEAIRRMMTAHAKAGSGRDRDINAATAAQKRSMAANEAVHKASTALNLARSQEAVASVHRATAVRRANEAESTSSNGNGGRRRPPTSVPDTGGGGIFGPGSIARRGLGYASVYAAATAIGTTSRTAASGIAEGSTQRTLTDLHNLPDDIRQRLERGSEEQSLKYRMLTKAGMMEIGRGAIGNLKDPNEATQVMGQLAKAAQVLSVVYGDPAKGIEAARQFYRGADVMSEAERAATLGPVMEALAKQTLISEKDINPRSVAQAIAQLGPAKFGMGNQMIGDIVGLSDEVRGRTADYLRTFNSDLTRANLADGNKEAMQRAGLRVAGAGAVNPELLQRDAFEWVMQQVKPLVQKEGVDLNDTNEARKAAGITAALNKLGFLRSGSQYPAYALQKEDEIRRNRTKRDRVKYDDATIQGLAGRDVKSSLSAVESGWKDAWDAATKPLQPAFSNFMGGLSDWLKSRSTEQNSPGTRLGLLGATAGIGAAYWAANNASTVALGAAALSHMRAAAALTAAAGRLSLGAAIGAAGPLGATAMGTALGAALGIAARASLVGVGVLIAGELAAAFKSNLLDPWAKKQKDLDEATRASVQNQHSSGRTDANLMPIPNTPDASRRNAVAGIKGTPAEIEADRKGIQAPVPGRANLGDLGSIGDDIRRAFGLASTSATEGASSLNSALSTAGASVQEAGAGLGSKVSGAGDSVIGALNGLASRIGSIVIPTPTLSAAGSGANVGTNQGQAR